MSANEDFLDDLLKSVTDGESEGTGDIGSIDMDSLMADIDSLDLGSLDFESLDFESLENFTETEETVSQAEPVSDSSNLEEALTMTQEEIEQLLRETQEASEEPAENKFDVNGDDLTQLLTGLDGEAGESGEEISDLLQKADNNQFIDEEMADMMMLEEEYDDASDLFLASLGEEEEPKKKGLFGRKKKEKKPKEKKKGKKEKAQVETAEAEETEAYVENLELAPPEIPDKPKKEKKAKKEKKGGLGSKFAALFADDEEDAADEILATLQEQNDAILMEMQAEDRAASKKKEKAEKKKKEKTKKEAKPKKEKKEKKPKKEKVTLVEPLEKEPKQYFPAKKAVTIMVVCLMLFAAFLVLNNALANHSNGMQAAEAFKEERYMECYQLLVGRDMTPEQEKMFYRSELILQMRLFKQHVNEDLSTGQEIGAVDKLVQFVYDYEQLLDYATKHECVDIVEGTYAEVTAALQTYGVTEEDAIAIAREITDKDYTKEIHRVVEGAHKKEAVVVEPIFKDMLPEEELRQP